LWRCCSLFVLSAYPKFCSNDGKICAKFD
jgi:hypothetical protein